jgi:hypothetical protein
LSYIVDILQQMLDNLPEEEELGEIMTANFASYISSLPQKPPQAQVTTENVERNRREIFFLPLLGGQQQHNRRKR